MQINNSTREINSSPYKTYINSGLPHPSALPEGYPFLPLNATVWQRETLFFFLEGKVGECYLNCCQALAPSGADSMA